VGKIVENFWGIFTIYEIETLVTENENYEAQLIWTWLQLSHTD